MNALLLFQLAQNPSPMVEHAREHPRLVKQDPIGQRHALELGTLYVPPHPKRDTLLIHFHGAPWIAELAAARGHTAVVSVQIGAGSSVYAKPFLDSGLFPRLVKEAEAKSGLRFTRITLSSWSAGYGAIREILKTNPDQVSRIVAIDSLHAGKETIAQDMAPFLAFARSGKPFLITHTEIYPHTFASTTETADHLLDQLGLRRKAVLKWGPMKTQQISEARRGKLTVKGFAGNTGPDHIDQLHSLPALLR